MTRIDFYILDNDTLQAREHFACRLIEKVQSQGHTIFVQSTDAQHAKLFDDLLWSFKPEAFVPHARSDSAIAKSCSVVIGSEQIDNQESIKNDVLINFNPTVPNCFSHYSRVVEIVNKQDDNSTDDGRARYKFYQDRGYKIESHKIRG